MALGHVSQQGRAACTTSFGLSTRVSVGATLQELGLRPMAEAAERMKGSAYRSVPE
jgi:hypothetical protein